MSASWLTPSGKDLLIAVKVIPKAGSDELAGERDGRLLLRVTAAPEAGKANAAARALLAKRLAIAKSRVELQTGETSRLKTFRVADFAPTEAEAALS